MGESRHYREFGLKYALNSVWLNPLTAALREGTTVCIDKVIGASRLAVGGVWINRRGVLGLNTAGKEEQRQSARTHRCWHAEWRQALPVAVTSGYGMRRAVHTPIVSLQKKYR